jgi:hypothetical protein
MLTPRSVDWLVRMRLMCAFVSCRGGIKPTFNRKRQRQKFGYVSEPDEESAGVGVILSFAALCSLRRSPEVGLFAGYRLRNRALPRSPLQRHASQQLYGRRLADVASGRDGDEDGETDRRAVAGPGGMN